MRAIIMRVVLSVVILALKTAHSIRPRHFNIGYRPLYGTEFCRAHLVGKVDRPDNRVVYAVEIHPDDAAKADAWTVRGAELRGGCLLEKGKYYRYALKEELYD